MEERESEAGRMAEQNSDRGAEEAKPAAAALGFGDPLDRRSSDDTDLGWGERPGGEGRERGLDWYLNQRPPHHGG
ncbi:hypothetical protein [Kitasatospora sp. NBC_01539]|uniref:hypothetical protein n=1 Tax=Kitasatospora sp. NBC_01539 TaxID=2903577 RepID=UPI0038602589